MCWRLSIILSLKYLGCKDSFVLYLLLVIRGMHDMQFYLSISQPFITARSIMVLLPHLDRSMLGIAVMLLNGLKFIKEFLKNSSSSCNWRYLLLYVWDALSAKIFYLAFHAKVGGS
jgi:hypothetical protein